MYDIEMCIFFLFSVFFMFFLLCHMNLVVTPLNHEDDQKKYCIDFEKSLRCGEHSDIDD